MSFQCGSDLLYQRYGMFALCILKPVASDTINYKFCPCKVFKKLLWNKLEAVKSSLLCMHRHLLHKVTYWRLKSKDNFQNMYFYWSVLATVWYNCICFLSSWMVALSWWNSWDWTAERDWRGGFPSADKQDLCLGNWRLQACLSENYNNHSMQPLLKPLYGSEGLAAVTHPKAVITGIGLGQLCFSCRKDTRVYLELKWFHF